MPLETRAAPFQDVGVRISVVPPGNPKAIYHAAGVHTGVLVLSGEYTLVLQDEARPLPQWDYFHCPADTRHVIVGGGDRPCAILMLGKRPDETIVYPVSEVAAKHGASAAKETAEPDEAYADWPGDYVPVRLPWPPADTQARERGPGHGRADRPPAPEGEREVLDEAELDLEQGLVGDRWWTGAPR